MLCTVLGGCHVSCKIYWAVDNEGQPSLRQLLRYPSANDHVMAAERNHFKQCTQGVTSWPTVSHSDHPYCQSYRGADNFPTIMEKNNDGSMDVLSRNID